MGILLYELLHGDTPFRAKNFEELIAQQKNEQIKYRKNLSEICKKLLKKMLKIDPTERANIDEILEKLSSL